ncbi:hypothetical protein BgiBS90_004672, partial [Biomphalaria glabrata]
VPRLPRGRGDLGNLGKGAVVITGQILMMQGDVTTEDASLMMQGDVTTVLGVVHVGGLFALKRG